MSTNWVLKFIPMWRWTGMIAEMVRLPQKYCWLTITAPDQPDLEIILMPIAGIDEESEKALRHLLNKGMMGAGVWQTNDCRATYEELKVKGVEFKSEPKEQFYGIECIITDGCGNWFSLTQAKDNPQKAVK
jgi:hypothetical protein